MKTINELKGEFFTSIDEAVEVLEDNNYDVLDINEESAIIIDITESDDEEIELFIIKAGNTIKLV